MTDDERRIRQLVETWIAPSKAGDVPGLLALMTDEVIFMTPGRPAGPGARAWAGRSRPGSSRSTALSGGR